MPNNKRFTAIQSNLAQIAQEVAAFHRAGGEMERCERMQSIADLCEGIELDAKRYIIENDPHLGPVAR